MKKRKERKREKEKQTEIGDPVDTKVFVRNVVDLKHRLDLGRLVVTRQQKRQGNDRQQSHLIK